MPDTPTITTNQVERQLNVREDFPDLRDRYYEPALLRLEPARTPPAGLPILDQGEEGACTGFALAAAINCMSMQTGIPLVAKEGASPRMLYEMARLHDEWEGEDYSGSSVRGVITGFFHNGVCRERDAPYRANERHWSLNVAQAKEARNVSLGAYYRLRPMMVDYHSALAETGVIVASAEIHSGWTNPDHGEIARTTRKLGGHAFAIIGYNHQGFIIQNSWGPGWGGYAGVQGTALWTYADWAWVLRLAVPTPEAFELTHLAPRPAGAALPEAPKHSPRRQDVIGHIIHVDDGKLVETGTYRCISSGRRVFSKNLAISSETPWTAAAVERKGSRTQWTG